MYNVVVYPAQTARENGLRDCCTSWNNDYLWNFWFTLKLRSTMPPAGKCILAKEPKKQTKMAKEEEKAAEIALIKQCNEVGKL